MKARALAAFTLLTGLWLPLIGACEDASLPRGVIQLDETVISGNQELPKVLYILPWREPGGLPDIELKAQFTEMDVFRRLYPPAYRRELSYFRTLNGSDSEDFKE
jgi:hypothetical protein